MLSIGCAVLLAATPFFGLNEDIVWNPEADWPMIAAQLDASGAESLRMPIRWRVVEPRRGDWDFTRVDRAIAAVPESIEILATLMSVPAWANGVNPDACEGWFDAYPPKDLADWTAFVETTVQRYKGRIRHWEIWNEQNGVDFYRPLPAPQGYTALLKAAYEAVKRADPNAVVVLGGLQMNGIIPNPWSPVKTPDFLEDLYKAGAGPYFDVCNIHPYVLPAEGAAHMMALISDTLALMDRYRDSQKPVWVTEIGCGLNAGTAPDAQAALLRDSLRLTRAEPRIQRVHWFLLRDMEKDLLGPEGSMGIVTRNFQEKPAYHAFVAAVREARAICPGDNAPNPELTTRAATGELAEANAAWWGFNSEDATECLQAAIDAGARRVRVPYMGAPWIVRPIRLRSHLVLAFDPGVVVLAKADEFKGKGDSLFKVTDAEDITLHGYGATLRMRKSDYQSKAYEKAEWRMTISLSGCSRIRIEGLRLESSGGDGIYLGATKRQPYCKDVVIRDVACVDHHRQGISVIGAENLLIENCLMAGTQGTAPQAGIDFEPNQHSERLVNCVVRNCIFTDNAGAGVLVYLKNLSRESAPVSLLIEDCLVNGGKDAGLAVGAVGDDGPQGWIEFRNCVVEGTGKAGAYVYDKSPDSAEVRFTQCQWRDTWKGSQQHKGPRVPLLFGQRRPAIASAIGGVVFTGCHVFDEVDRPVLKVEHHKDGAGLRGLRGQIFVHNPHGARADLGEASGEAGLSLVAMP